MSAKTEASASSGGEGASVADRTPTLAQLLRRDDLRRVLGPFVGLGLAGMGIFDANGEPFLVVSEGEGGMAAWAVLPAEGLAALRGTEAAEFGLDHTRFAVRAAYAGADRLGSVVFQAPPESGAEFDARVRAVHGVVASLLQAGFATWVTSELHLAASESSYLALESKNAELERAVEHLRELDKLKSNFLATVSHELRTPLTSVIGFSEMLLQGIAGELNSEQHEFVTTIFERGEELLRLITQILEMSRLEMGAVRLAVEPCWAGDLGDRAVDAVRLVAEKAGVSVRHEIDRTLNAVMADADKIHQVLVNLLTNAVKFTREGGEVVVGAETAPIARPLESEDFFGEEVHDAMRISVRDTGIGIPQAQLNQVFEAFYQVDATSTREHGGAGLGLSIVKKLVEAHGGEVWVESTVGVGTTFFFTLPLVGEEASQPADSRASSG